MRRDFVKNASLSAGSQMAAGLAAVGISVLVARSLGPHDAGEYSLVVTLIILAATVSKLGLPLVITRRVASAPGGADGHEARELTWWAVRGVLAVSSLVVLAGAAMTVFGLPHGTDRGTIVLSALAVPLTAVPSVLAAVVIAHKRFDALMRVSFAVAAVQLLGTVAVTVADGSVRDFIAPLVLGGAVQTVLLWRVLRDELRTRRLPSREVRRGLRRDMTTVSGVVVADTVVFQRTEVLFLAALSTAEEVAFYAMPHALVSRGMSLIPGAIVNTLLPNYASAQPGEDMNRIHGLATRYLMLVAAPLAAAGFALAEPLIDVLYGPAFAPAAPVLALLAVTSSAVAVMSAGTMAIYGAGRQTVLLKANWAVAVVNLGLAAALTGPLGALGAALALGSAQLIGLVVVAWYVVTRMSLSYPGGAMARTAGAAVLAGLLAAGAAGIAPNQVVALGAGIVVFGAAYPAALLLSGALPDDERAAVTGRLRRLARRG